MKAILPVVLLTACCIAIAACSDRPVPQAGSRATHVDEAATPTAGTPLDVSMGVQVTKMVGDAETTEVLKRIVNPEAETIEREVRAIDWHDFHSRPHVGIGRRVDGAIRNLSLKGTIGTPNLDGQFRAYWLGVVDDTVTNYRSPPLESVDAAVELLLRFRTDEEKLNAMVLGWEDAK